MTTNFIAFDLGSNFGWYNGHMGGTRVMGKHEKFLDFFISVYNLIEKFEPKAIVYEDAKFQKGNAIYVFNGLKAILDLIAQKENIPFIGYPVGTVKKTFTGKGNASKEDMMSKCDELGIDYVDHNHADAIAIYHTHIQHISN